MFLCINVQLRSLDYRLDVLSPTRAASPFYTALDKCTCYVYIYMQLPDTISVSRLPLEPDPCTRVEIQVSNEGMQRSPGQRTIRKHTRQEENPSY